MAEPGQLHEFSSKLNFLIEFCPCVLVISAAGVKKAYTILSIHKFGKLKVAQRGHPNEEAVDLEEVQGLQAVQGLPPLNRNMKTFEEVLSRDRDLTSSI